MSKPTKQQFQKKQKGKKTPSPQKPQQPPNPRKSAKRGMVAVRRGMANNPAMGRALTRFLMLPFDTPGLRLPTVDSPVVATAQFRYPTEFLEKSPLCKWNGISCMAAVFGQPGLTFISGPYFDNGPMTTELYFHNPALSETWRWFIEPTAPEWTHDVIEFNTPWPLADVKLYPTSERVPILEHEGRRYVHMQDDDDLFFEVSLDGGTAKDRAFLFDITVLLEEGAHVCRDFKVVVPAGANAANNKLEGLLLSIPAPTAGAPASMPVPRFGAWVHVTLKSLTRNDPNDKPTNMKVRLSIRNTTGTSARVRLHYLEDIVSSPSIAQEMRRTACTLLVTNTSAPLIRQGDVIAARVDCTSAPGIIDLARFKKAARKHTGDASKGCYTYMEFPKECEEFLSHVTELGCPLAHFQNTMYNLITIKNSNASSAPNSYLMTCDIAIEFKTESQLYRTEVPYLPFEELIHARRISNSTNYFYDNPLHWSQITRLIGQAWNGMRRNATKLGTVASIMYPEAAPAIMPLARYLQK